MSANNQLIPIAKSEWTKLRDLFKIDSPKHYISYSTIQNYITWVEQDPNIKHVQIYSLNGNFSDGTYLILDRYHVLCNTLNKNLDNLLNALCCLDKTKTYFLYGFVDRVLPAVVNFFDKIELPFKPDEPDTTTDWFYLSRENALQFKYTVPEGLILKSLTVDFADVVNDLWPYKHAGSLGFLKRQIKYNPSIGLFDEKSNEIIAWCLISLFGALGTLEVKNKYKRKGYGTLIVKAFSKQLAESGKKIIIAPVVTLNEPSRNMFLKCGFKINDKLHWIPLPLNPSDIWCDELDK